MPDAIDKSVREQEAELERNIEAARGIRYMEGPRLCIICGEPNDRRHDGYATCSYCVEVENGEV